MSPIEQAAYFWSYVLVENKNNEFDESGIEHPFEGFCFGMGVRGRQVHGGVFSAPRRLAVPGARERGDSELEGRDCPKAEGGNGEEGKVIIRARFDHSPSVLILCISAIRCTELLKWGLDGWLMIRELADLKVFIPKLFGKHIKVEEQKKSLNKVTPLAIGVPNRVLRLIEDGVLDLSNVSTLIIDMKEYGTEESVMSRNEKTMNVISLKETREAFVKLYMKYLHNGVIHNTTKVLFW